MANIESMTRVIEGHARKKSSVSQTLDTKQVTTAMTWVGAGSQSTSVGRDDDTHPSTDDGSDDG